MMKQQHIYVLVHHTCHSLKPRGLILLESFLSAPVCFSDECYSTVSVTLSVYFVSPEASFTLQMKI